MYKLFSVVIPCYNAQDHVDHALSSVTGQTLGNDMYEIIAVNDASTDDTLAVLNGWKDRYPDTIKVITYDENLRQGGARNRAIREAKGEYICFLDADDLMEPDALETFMTGIGNGEADIVTAKFKVINGYSSSVSVKPEYAHAIPAVEKVFDPETNMEEYIDFDLGFVWSSVYRRKMIIDNEVWFPEHLAYEDVYWQRLIKFYAKKACLIDAVTHDYFVHPGSTMNSRNAKHHINRLTCYEMLLEAYEQRGILKQYSDIILKDAIETYVFNSYYMFFTIMDDIPDVYDRVRTTLYKYFPDWETRYDDSEIPMVLQYFLKYLKKAKTAKPADLQVFKDAMTAE